MPPIQRAVLLAASICFLAFVVLMVRKNRISMKYSLLWIVLGCAGILAAALPVWVFALSDLLGFEEPINFLTVACIFYLMAVAFACVSIASGQSERIRGLIQDVSLLTRRVEELEERLRAAEQAAACGLSPEHGADDGKGERR